MAEDKQKAVQQKMAELQMLAARIKQLQEQTEALESQSQDSMNTQQNLTEIGKVEKNTEIMAPIASGIFMKANIQDPDKVLVNVGGSAFVPKTIEGAKKMLDKQLDEISKVQKEISVHLSKLNKEAREKEAELMKLMK